MDKYLVVDSGGSKTIAVIFDKNKTILGKGVSKGGNSYSIGDDQAIKNVINACKDALNEAKVQVSDIKKTYLFIPSFKTCIDKFNEITGLNAEIQDEIDALKFASFENDNGIVILAGTGSFGCVFINETKISMGGWGAILGDEGSAYDIGLTFIKNCIKIYEKGVNSLAIDETLKFYNIKSISELKKKSSFNYKTREEIAALAKLVTKLAEENVEIAKTSLYKCLDKLVDIALVLYKKSNLTCELKVALFGGVKNAGPIVTNYFATKLNEVSNGKLVYLETTLEPYEGGILMMLENEIK